MTNQVNNPGIIPLTDVMQLTFTLKMTTAQVVETYMFDSFRGAAHVGYSWCHNGARVDVGLSAGISVTESVPSKKVHVVVVFTKNVV